MSVMDFFRGVKSPIAEPAPVVPQSVLNNPTVPSPNTPNPADGKNASTAFGAGAVDPTKAPLGNFDKLWESDPNYKAPTSAVPTLQADPTKMMELARTVDFTRQISPELMARAQKGESAALVEVINNAAQAGFAHSSLATTEIVKSALTEMNTRYETDIIPRILQAERTRNVVAEDSPIFSNPAAQPVVEMVRNQMMLKFPTATPEEIKRQTLEYINGFSSLVVSQDGKTITDPKAAASKPGAMARNTQDWEKLLT